MKILNTCNGDWWCLIYSTLNICSCDIFIKDNLKDVWVWFIYQKKYSEATAGDILSTVWALSPCKTILLKLIRKHRYLWSFSKVQRKCKGGNRSLYTPHYVSYSSTGYKYLAQHQNKRLIFLQMVFETNQWNKTQQREFM